MSDRGLSARLEEIVRRAAKLAPTAPVAADTRFVEDMGIDSLDLVAVFLEVQDTLGVAIDDDDIPSLKTLGDLVGYVARRSDSIAA
jgi:acyl carrier protein